MPQLISQELVATQRRVYLRFLDAFGTPFTASVSITGAGPTVAEKTASTLAELTAAEDAIKAYAASAKQDISAQLEAGAAAIAAAVAEAAAKGITPPSN